MGILDRVLGKKAGPAKDRFRPEVQERFDGFVAAAKTASPWDDKLTDLAPTAAILNSDERDQIDTIIICLGFLDEHVAARSQGRVRYADGDFAVQTHAGALARRLLKRGLPYTTEDFVALLDRTVAIPHVIPLTAVVRAVEKQAAGGPVDGPVREALKRFDGLLARSHGTEVRKLQTRVKRLLAGPRTGPLRVDAVDAWTHALAHHVGDSPDEALSALLDHCSRATSSKPSQKWRKEVAGLIETLGLSRHSDLLAAVVPAIGSKAPFPVKVAAYGHNDLVDGDPTLVSDRYSDLLRGIIWSAVEGDLDAHLSSLGDAAERCFKKLAGHGPLAPKVGNACLYVLSQASSLDGVGQLSRLKTRVKHASVRAQLEKALAAAAERAGLSTADLEDIAVPTCGLTETGKRVEQLGEFTAELSLVGTAGTELRWIKPSGKPQKTVPAAVKADFPDELAALKKSARELKKMLPAQRARIERMLLNQRSLPFADWKERYWEHPLVGYLARRLIWRVGDEGLLLAAESERLVDLQGNDHTPDDSAAVRLWHPIESPAETVRAWREWLAEREMTQPFKQAHREIYLLTDAERVTETYSNRFAAHVLKQHQFNALCRERGWHYTLQGGWDSHNTPFIELPEQGLRVEYWVDPAGHLEAEMTEAAVYLYIATDQVRFCRMQDDGPMRLEDVPRVVFSELLRDVDLFVGVCSVGNDPTWRDGGPNGRYRDYWESYAFGDLTESAKTRRAALERIVPKLKIADRCTLDDKFLTVRGELRTYHLHLGSGNIRMSPNDQYLCIVPGRRAGSAPTNIMLPFEGDSVLSIILSKAFMLAADKKIKDPSIVSQIKGR